MKAPAPLARLSQSGRPLLVQAIIYAGLVVCAAAFIVPVLWMVTTAFKAPSEVRLSPPVWLPETPRLSNFSDAWNAAPFGLYLRNTLIVTGGALVGQVLCAITVAYGFARLRFPGRDLLFGLVLATIMLPELVTMVPNFVLFQKLGWIDTFWPLIVPAWFGGIGGAFYIFLLRQAFRGVPTAYSEAAELDGASHLRILWTIVVPLCKPTVATVVVLSFIERWNDFVSPLIYLTSRDNFTLNLGLSVFFQTHSVDYNLLMAAALMVALPVIVLFILAQRYLVRGMTLGGLNR